MIRQLGIRQGRPAIWLTTGALAVLVVTGLTVVPAPLVAILPVGAMGAALVATNAQVRAILVVFGGLAVLQSSSGLGVNKLAYFMGAAIAWGSAVANMHNPSHEGIHALARPLFRASIALFSMILLSFVVAHVNGTTPVSWLRDAAPYLLVVCAPAFAIDFAGSLSRRQLIWILGLGAVVSGFSFTFEFASRHALASPAITKFALPSLLFPAALFSYAISASLQRPRTWRRWTFVAAGLLALLFLSGTRSVLTFTAAPIVILFVSRFSFTSRVVRMFGFAVVILVAGFLATQYVTRLGISTAAFEERFSSLPAVLSHPLSDQSYVERRSQQNLAWDAYHSSPLLGVGPGHLFAATDTSGNTTFQFTLDTSISFLAKFGLVGLIALIAWATFVGSYVRRIRVPGREAGPARAALIGFFAIVAAFALLDPPFEDKGFAFGFLLLVALSVRERMDAVSRDDGVADAESVH